MSLVLEQVSTSLFGHFSNFWLLVCDTPIYLIIRCFCIWEMTKSKGSVQQIPKYLILVWAFIPIQITILEKVWYRYRYWHKKKTYIRRRPEDSYWFLAIPYVSLIPILHHTNINSDTDTRSLLVSIVHYKRVSTILDHAILLRNYLDEENRIKIFKPRSFLQVYLLWSSFLLRYIHCSGFQSI